MQDIKIRCRGVILHEGKLLLVKHSHGKNFYAFPGGHLDFGEDPQECMKRELVEELGIAPQVGRLLFVYTFFGSNEQQSIEFFFEIENSGDYLTHNEMEKTHAYEIAEVAWVTPEEEGSILPEPLGTRFREGKLLSENHTTFITVRSSTSH